MQSKIVKRSVVIGGRKTSVSLEDEFWQALVEMARGSQIAVSALIRQIDKQRNNENLSSALRLAAFAYFDRRRND